MEKYITRDEYLGKMGIDLEIELPDNDNRSKKVETFIKSVTNWCVRYLMINYDNNDLLDWNSILESRQEHFRNGVMEQIQYILNNGRVDKSSGFSKESNTYINLSGLVLGDYAYEEFFLGGFCNVVRG